MQFDESYISKGRPTRYAVVSNILDAMEFERVIDDLCLCETEDIKPQLFPSIIDWSYWL